jgi:hypothetical protein
MVQAVDMLDEDEYKSLSPDAKEKYVRETLNELLHENPEGITRSDIRDVTPFGRKTIDKHLEKLVALNEGYVRRMGGTDVYYPNGKLLHGSEEAQQINGKTFKVKQLENISGESVYIQEVEQDKFGGEEVQGGLLIPKDEFSAFVSWLDDLEAGMEETDG